MNHSRRTEMTYPASRRDPIFRPSRQLSAKCHRAEPLELRVDRIRARIFIDTRMNEKGFFLKPQRQMLEILLESFVLIPVVSPSAHCQREQTIPTPRSARSESASSLFAQFAPHFRKLVDLVEIDSSFNLQARLSERCH